MLQSQDLLVGAEPAERSWRAVKSFFAVNVAKQGIYARYRACPETPLKLFAIKVAKQGFVG
jgi:hypothetical protein